MIIPHHSLELVGLTDDIGESTDAVQFCVRDPEGLRHVYGDQSWVATGTCITDGSHPSGRIQYRTVTISYGEWTDMEDPAARQERARLIGALRDEAECHGGSIHATAYIVAANFLANLGGAA